MITNRIFLFVICLIPGLVFGISQKVYGANGGAKYFKNYTPQDYKHPPQNWCILHDQRGIIYVANQGSILEFDGVSWKAVDVTNRAVRSLAIDDTGTIYVGGSNEIGFLAPDSKGKLQYQSLLDHIDENKRAFATVWGTHAAEDGIYFLTSKYLFRWKAGQKQMTIWEPKGDRFNISFDCNGKFFVHQRNVGLMQVVNNSLKLIPGDEAFASVKIFMLDNYDSAATKLLIGTRSNGFYIYDYKSTKTVPFPTEADHYLEEKKICHGIRLSNGDFAFATRIGGLVIIDSRGRLKHIFTKASGLQDGNVKHVFEDSQGNLWLALSKGISKIEYHSPISLYDEQANLTGLILSVVRHRDDLYAGTTNGLFILTPGNKFHPVSGISGSCWSLLSTGDSLLAATTYGVFQLDNKNSVKKEISRIPSNVLQRSIGEPDRIWVGTRQGLVTLHLTGDKWAEEYQYKNTILEIKTIAEEKTGNLWLGTPTGKVLKVDFSVAGKIAHPVVKRYDKSQGLPTGEIHVFLAADHTMFATEKGIFRFDEKTGTFIPDTTLGAEFAGGPGERGVYRIVEDINKNIWFHSRGRNFRAIFQPDGGYLIDKKSLLRISRIQANAIYHDPDGFTTWFACHNGLVCYDTRIKKNCDHNFSAFIRTVRLINDKSLLFNGYKVKVNETPSFPIIAYKDRNLRFEYAAPFFEDETRTEYSYFLEGYDDDWTPWTQETQKDYTNLDAGDYTFRVRAKNVYEHLSKEDVFRFKVLPPWYRTWWAYTMYALCAALLFYLVLQWRHSRLVKEKKQLEQTVKDRTREIEDKNRQLEIQSEQLKELDEAKSRFFANISHEFRTPLTLIMGPLEQILASNPDKEMKTQAHLMLRNSQRLLNLVNQLLELARLDSGKMKLEASEQNIIPFLKSIVMCFESLAAQNKVDLIVHEKEEGISLYFDAEKLEKIISNLTSNAFKYTPAHGKITISVRKVARTDRFPSGCVEISVRDTGTGIPEDRLSHIFDRFYRAEGMHEHKQKGSGIGLALTKELVLLHHGEIDVNSSCREGDTRGTEFIIRLPLGKEHLQPEEIAEIKEPKEPPKQSPAYTPGTYEYEVEEEVKKEEAVETGKEEKPLILVVDDNPDVRLYIRGTLEPHFKVIEAADGSEGILRAKEIIPDLIISDVMMPNTDGYELCRTLKKDVLTSHVPIILLTARVSEESVLEGLETGADDYITKPFSTAALTVRVRNLIELRRQLQLERKNRMTFQPEEISVSPIDDEFYKELQNTVETYLSDPDFNVEALSRVLQMSQATLYRKIHALTGKTPTLFIRIYRLKRAAQLLGARAGSVSDVAVKVGFLDKSYFAKCFKEQFNCLPSEKREAENNQKLLRGVQGGGFLEKSPPGRRRQEIILVVEDSDDARGYIRESLEPDYHVVEAADGSEGIARAMEIIPDLIVSDIMMPGTDGYELCRVLKKDVRTCHIPIVLLTAKATEESMIRGLETGADDYITKPFNTDILRVRIKNLINLRSHLQNKRNREMTLLPAKISESEIDREFMMELNAVIEKNLSDPDFNVEQLAKKLYMSSATLYRKIQAVSGEIPSEYIRSHRLRRAAQLLKSNFGSITEVAFEVGFSSRAYFTKCFKEKFHQLPSLYMAAESQ